MIYDVNSVTLLLPPCNTMLLPHDGILLPYHTMLLFMCNTMLYQSHNPLLTCQQLGENGGTVVDDVRASALGQLAQRHSKAEQ